MKDFCIEQKERPAGSFGNRATRTPSRPKNEIVLISSDKQKLKSTLNKKIILICGQSSFRLATY